MYKRQYLKAKERYDTQREKLAGRYKAKTAIYEALRCVQRKKEAITYFDGSRQDNTADRCPQDDGLCAKGDQRLYQYAGADDLYETEAIAGKNKKSCES